MGTMAAVMAVGVSDIALYSNVAIATVAALIALFGRRLGGDRVALRDLVVLTAFMAVVVGVEIGLLLTLGVVDRFGVAHVLYLFLVLGVPLFAIIVLLLPTFTGYAKAVARPTAPALLTLPLLIVPMALGWYATHVVPNRLTTTTASVGLDPGRSGAGAVRVGVIGDIQTNSIGDHEWNAVTRLMEQRPQVIFVVGDLFQGTDEDFARELPEFRELLASLSAPAGVYAVLGNSESKEQMTEMVRGTGVQFLFNSEASVQIGDRQVTVAGTDYHLSWNGPLDTIAALERPGAGDIRILLAHTPDVIEHVPANSRIDLIVSGHTHGGQIALPAVGVLFDNVRVPREVAAGGMSVLNGRRIWVTTGVGVVREQAPQVRFGVTPTVDVLTLDTAAQGSPS
jgi:predicted MPP superfamily phosphohydrolase